MMILDTIPSLTNGTDVQLWGTKPSPLNAFVFMIDYPQKGKSRLSIITDEIFEACDEIHRDCRDDDTDSDTIRRSQ